MPNFSYRGRSGTGETVQGILEGPTAGAVADMLTGSGVTPMEIKPAAATGTGGSVNIEIFKQKVRHIDVLLFSKQIYTLLKAGVPIMRALTGLQESSTNPAMKTLLQDVRDSLDSGRELSAALARHPKVFTGFYVSMVRVGEMTGRLEEVFIRLFDHMEFERYMKEQVKSALRYPSFVVAAMAIAMIVANVVIIPAFSKVFKGYGADLPLMTRILLNSSEFTIAWWPAMLIGAVALGFGFAHYIRTRIGRLWWDEFKLKIPIAGSIILKATLSRFARSFALASRSGVPIIQALSNVAATVDNAYLASKLDEMRDGVERGESILRTAIRTKVFTPVVIQMIAVGEESGALDEMMQEVADMYQNEVEYALKTLGQRIEPILIIVMGIMVLILALGIFLPMWDLGRVATKR
jgi:MSHA biogenesis protein MshG